MDLKTNKIYLSLFFLIIFVFIFWFFTGRILLADYYYQQAKKAEDWPNILKSYQKVFQLNSQEPFYHQKFANDLKWGIKFYKSEENKLQIIDLAISQMERIKQAERSFGTRIYLAQLYLLKSGLTQKQEDFLNAEKAFQEASQMSSQVAKVYVDWCQLKIYEQQWERAGLMCKKVFYLYPFLTHPKLTRRHRKIIQAEMSQVYEKLGEIYLARKEYSKAEQVYKQILKFFPLSRPDIWKKLGDVYYLQGNLEESIAKNLHGHTLRPRDPFWCLTLTLLYQEKGNFNQALAWVEKGLKLEPDNEKLLFLKNQLSF